MNLAIFHQVAVQISKIVYILKNDHPALRYGVAAVKLTQQRDTLSFAVAPPPKHKWTILVNQGYDDKALDSSSWLHVKLIENMSVGEWRNVTLAMYHPPGMYI